MRAAIANRLGWLHAHDAMRGHVPDLERFAADVRADGITDVVLLGMGGSSLAPDVLKSALGAAPGHPRLTVLDSTDPGQIRATLAALTLTRTLFVVSSKSGTTTEMSTLYRFFRKEVEARTAHAGTHFVAITDPGTPLEKLATESGFRRTFVNDPRIGGRFSALSFFGLVPAALIGVDLDRLLDRAAAMAARCGPDVPAHENPGLHLGATLAGLAQAGRDKVTLLVSPGIRALGTWLEQLLTESTGKLGRGLVVVNDEPVGPPAVYGHDRVFVTMSLGGDAALESSVSALAAAGHPIVRLALQDPYDLGAEFFRWEMATAAAGVVLGLNPFDEPNVAQAKDATNTALARFLETGRLPEWPTDSVDELARVVRDARPGDYVALLAYLTPAAGDHRRAPAPAPHAAGRDAPGDDHRLWPALPALDRAAPQGRAADSHPRDLHDDARGAPDPRRTLRLRDARDGPGPRRSRHAARGAASRPVAASRRGAGRHAVADGHGPRADPPLVDGPEGSSSS